MPEVCVYLAGAGGAWCAGIAPQGATQARDAVRAATRPPGVRGLGVVRTWVRNAARTTLPLQHTRVITQQDRTGKRYTAYFSLLHTHTHGSER